MPRHPVGESSLLSGINSLHAGGHWWLRVVLSLWRGRAGSRPGSRPTFSREKVGKERPPEEAVPVGFAACDCSAVLASWGRAHNSPSAQTSGLDRRCAAATPKPLRSSTPPTGGTPCTRFASCCRARHRSRDRRRARLPFEKQAVTPAKAGASTLARHAGLGICLASCPQGGWAARKLSRLALAKACSSMPAGQASSGENYSGQ